MKKLHRAILLALLLCSANLLATYTIGTSNGKAGNVSGATTDAIDSSGNDICLYAEADYVASAAGTYTDSKSNTISNLSAGTSTNMRGFISYAKNCTVGTGHTATTTGAYSPAILLVASGSDLTSPFDQQNGGTTNGASSLATGSITPSENNELVCASLAAGGALGTLTIDTGWTIQVQVDYHGGFNFSNALSCGIQTTATPVNATWSWTGSDAVARIASFKMGGGGPPPSTNHAFGLYQLGQ